MNKCCFAGYTAFELSYGEENYIKLKSAIKHVLLQLIREGYNYYLCGFDQGSDLYFAESLMELKSGYPDIYLQSVIPYEDQASDWSETDRNMYFNLLAKCDEEAILRTHYDKDCFIARNKYMVAHTDILLAVFDDRLSLTMQIVNYAKRLSKRLICIDPSTYCANEINPTLHSISSY